MRITEEDVLDRLRGLIRYDVKIKDLAAKFEVSSPFMSRVLAGKDPPTKPMLDALGIRKITVFETTD